MQAIYNSLPFMNMPPQIVIEMDKYAVYWLNAFPHQNGVSDTLSPCTIITGQNVDFNRHCKYEFGQYVQTHEQHDNRMAPRTIGVLAMRTGRLINCAHATKLPMLMTSLPGCMCWPDDRKQPLVYCSLIAIGFQMMPLMTQIIPILMQTIVIMNLTMMTRILTMMTTL
jgi:hypothetical protein